MKSQRDLFILIGLFALLIAFVAISPSLQAPPSDPDLPTSHSSEPNGALALYSWLRTIGYDARRLEYREFALDEDDAALIILNPSVSITPAHADSTLAWVERGGTLILADDTTVAFGSTNALLDQLDVDFAVYTTTQTFEEPIQQARPGQPALDQPPTGQTLVRTGRVVLLDRYDYVNLVGADDALVVAGIKYGRGYVYLSSATFPFTNEGLRNGENAALVLNLIRRVPKGGRIQFDEYHHGYFTPPSTTSLVLGSPLGWAGAYAVAAIALYLILSGRRFGRPVPLQTETARRSSAEYVESMADLFQRGGKRGYILGHYHAAFKRKLARRDGVNPQLDDAEFVRELARVRPTDEAGLLALLGRLRDERADEAAVVRAVASADEIIRQRG